MAGWLFVLIMLLPVCFVAILGRTGNPRLKRLRDRYLVKPMVWLGGQLWLVYRQKFTKETAQAKTDYLVVRSQRLAKKAAIAQELAETDSMPNGEVVPRTAGSLAQPEDVHAILTKRLPVWMPDKNAHACGNCAAKFGMFFRKHHCRFCLQIFCSSCSKYNLLGQRACTRCFNNRGYAPLVPSVQAAQKKLS
eukprot:gb/GEZN01016963.1/.p1 GENE.gb/GEZN01016963.1/~~gb/GEZN01016963.1/.p1  ORF type:complete len:192 (-),score=6.63 gb/GEZN01016963.1/:168-743(-)